MNGVFVSTFEEQRFQTLKGQIQIPSGYFLHSIEVFQTLKGQIQMLQNIRERLDV